MRLVLFFCLVLAHMAFVHAEEPAAIKLPDTLIALQDKPQSTQKVLVLGVDGTRADALKACTIPTIRRMMTLGTISWTGNAGGGATGPTNQPTISGPGWSSVLTGVWTDKHGVVDNKFTIKNYASWPHFFVRLKEVNATLRTASFVSWHPIEDTIVGHPANIKAVDVHAKGLEKEMVKRDQEVVEMALKHLANENPDVLFVYVEQVDHNGHKSGFTPLNPNYMAAIERVDGLLAQLLLGLEKRPNIAHENWQLIFVVDHGGKGKGHGGQSPEERTIPFLIAGGKIKPGVESTSSPDQASVPASAARHLGIAVKPEWSWEKASFDEK